MGLSSFRYRACLPYRMINTFFSSLFLLLLLSLSFFCFSFLLQRDHSFPPRFLRPTFACCKKKKREAGRFVARETKGETRGELREINLALIFILFPEGGDGGGVRGVFLVAWAFSQHTCVAHTVYIVHTATISCPRVYFAFAFCTGYRGWFY